MLQQQILSEIVSRIRSKINPDQIVLFGSQASGTARNNSDFDVLVINKSDQPRYRRSATLYSALANLPIEVDVVVYTPEEVEEWSEVPEAFVSTALREGKVLYEEKNRHH